MSDINTGSDSLQFFLTVASAANDPQPDSNLSLGGFISSQRYGGYVISLGANTLPGISVDYVSPSNPEAVPAGVITGTGADTLTWTPTGGVAGAEVTILDTESKTLSSDASPDQYITITRTGSTSLSGGSLAVNTVAHLNGLFDDINVAESVAGDIEYRVLAVKCVNSLGVNTVLASIQPNSTTKTSSVGLAASGAGTIEASSSFTNMDESGFARIEDASGVHRETVYYESRDSNTLNVPANGRAQHGTSASAGASGDKITQVSSCRIAIKTAQPALANESTQPAAAVWTDAFDNDNAVSMGNMNVNDVVFILIERTAVQGQKSSTDNRLNIQATYEIN